MAKRPPVPPAGRSPKGPGETGDVPPETTHKTGDAPNNLHEQGDAGNIQQNTTNDGYQQDR